MKNSVEIRDGVAYIRVKGDKEIMVDTDCLPALEKIQGTVFLRKGVYPSYWVGRLSRSLAQLIGGYLGLESEDGGASWYVFVKDGNTLDLRKSNLRRGGDPEARYKQRVGRRHPYRIQNARWIRDDGTGFVELRRQDGSTVCVELDSEDLDLVSGINGHWYEVGGCVQGRTRGSDGSMRVVSMPRLIARLSDIEGNPLGRSGRGKQVQLKDENPFNLRKSNIVVVGK